MSRDLNCAFASRTTHFAPRRRVRAAPGSPTAPTMVSVTALAGIPNLVAHAFGESVLRQANRAAMLDVELIEDQNCFIPHTTLTAFLNEVERRTGEPNIGLMVAPHLSVGRYGCFGDYILEAQTLGEAIERAIRAMEYHSRGDRAGLAVSGGVAVFAYASATHGRDGYRHVACGALGVMLDLCRRFAPPGWRPLRIEMNVPRPPHTHPFETTFGCPILFGATRLAVCLEARILDCPNPSRRAAPRITLSDLARARLAAGRHDLAGVVEEHIRLQVLTGAVSIESTARALDISVRSLQRALNQGGIDFRGMTNHVRACRAKELLIETDASVTQIAFDLGYSSPAHFARAFRNVTGAVPSEFRRRCATSRA